MKSRGIDTKRVLVMPVITVEQFKKQIIAIIEEIKKNPDNKILFGLDSLGNLSTEKEISDAIDGKDTKDMTRAQLIKGAFRVITLQLGLIDSSLIVTNHVYSTMGMFSKKIMSGGCLTPGQKIIMADGTLKAIESVHVGDYVKTLMGNQKVIAKWHPKNLVDGTPHCYKIKISCGESVECSENHRFLLMNENGFEWIKAKHLKKGDILCSMGTKYMKIVDDIEYVGRKEVYDITVKTANSYILENGIICHNSGLSYCGSINLMLSKRQNVKGSSVIVTAKVEKGRLTKENSTGELLIDFNKGLDKYWGIPELLVETGHLTKKGAWYYDKDNNTVAQGRDNLLENIENILTDEMLDDINKVLGEKYKYGLSLDYENKEEDIKETENG